MRPAFRCTGRFVKNLGNRIAANNQGALNYVPRSLSHLCLHCCPDIGRRSKPPVDHENWDSRYMPRSERAENRRCSKVCDGADRVVACWRAKKMHLHGYGRSHL